MKRKILIIGLIDDFGGREIETKNIISALSTAYRIRVISLLFMTDKSVALKNSICEATNIYKEIYNSNLALKILSVFSKIYNKSKLPAYFSIDNTLSNRITTIFNKKVDILKKEIQQSDAVLYIGIIDLHLLENIIQICDIYNKPIIIRTTGKIVRINELLKEFLPCVSTILIHSNTNATLLSKISSLNLRVIDQTTLLEQQLLAIPIEKKRKFIFGYIGRFSEEKGIVELLKIIKKQKIEIVVAGSGNQENQVLELMGNKELFLGEISPENLDIFFRKIDVLIIPSKEDAGPLVGIEAMAAGKLIFSTKVGAMMERLSKTENDFWFDIKNENSFLQLLEKLDNLKQEEIKLIRDLNRKIYIDNYSVNEISTQYLEVFDNLWQ